MPPSCGRYSPKTSRREGIDPGIPSAALLGEIALTGQNVWHPFFALECLFEAARDGYGVRRLRELTGRVDAFRLLAGNAARDAD